MFNRLAVSMPLSDSRALELVLRNGSDHGFAGVILKCEQYEPFLGDPAGFIGRWGDRAPDIAGLEVRSAVTTDAGRDTIDRVIRLAVGIDGDLLILACKGPPLSSRPEEAERFAAAIRAIGDKARSGGLRLLIVNRRGSALESRSDIEAFCGISDPAVAGLALDTAHLTACDETRPGEVLRDALDRLDAVCLKDIKRSRLHVLEDYKIEFPPHGEGDVDFPTIVRVLEENDYTGWIIVDHETTIADLGDALSRAAAFLRTHGIRPR